MTDKSETVLPTWVENLRQSMAEQGLNPRSLSLRAGLNATAVRDMIEGRSRFPRYDTVQALADVLKTTPARLMSDPNRGPESSAPTDSFGPDVELLTEIIARLQETAREMDRTLSPREFAAMSATIYRKMHEGDRSGTATTNRKNRVAAIKPQIHDLLDYEGLRSQKAK